MVEKERMIRIRFVIIDYDGGQFVYYEPVDHYWAYNQIQQVGVYGYINRYNDLEITLSETLDCMIDLDYEDNIITIKRIDIKKRHKKLVEKINLALEKMRYTSTGKLGCAVGKRIHRYLKKICELEIKGFNEAN